MEKAVKNADIISRKFYRFIIKTKID